MSDEARLFEPVGEDDHVLGPADAEITIVEYGDYQCPYCGRAHPIVKRLLSDFGPKVRLVFRNMPLTNVHPRALAAAEAAEAVALQGHFWAMHDLLFEHQGDLSDEALARYAKEAGADLTEMDEALAGGEPGRRVNADVESGLRSGVNGTPTFYVNGLRYDDSWDYETFHGFLADLLA